MLKSLMFARSAITVKIDESSKRYRNQSLAVGTGTKRWQLLCCSEINDNLSYETFSLKDSSNLGWLSVRIGIADLKLTAILPI